MIRPEKQSVLVTRPVFPEALERLRQAAEAVFPHSGATFSRQELKEKIAGKQGLLSQLTDRVDAELMDAAGGLKVIANCAVGYDNIDLEAATRRRIQVSNTPGVLTEATADLTWALLLAVARKVVVGDRTVRGGGFHGWDLMDFLGQELTGTTLGILGMGRIGQAVARRAFGFRMRVLYTDLPECQPCLSEIIPRNPDLDLGPHLVGLSTLLQEADFVSIHLPLTESTRHLIGWKELSRMKPTAYLINTARGKVVREEDLVRALQEKHIAGAGLDVYENEPTLAGGLAEMENAVLLPHMGSATRQTRLKMAMMAVENIVEGLKGKRVPNLVNVEAFGTGLRGFVKESS